jgi:lysozyme family protein
MAPTLSSLKSKYDPLFESCLVRPARASKLRFSVDDAWQRAHGQAATPFPSVF